MIFLIYSIRFVFRYGLNRISAQTAHIVENYSNKARLVTGSRGEIGQDWVNQD